MNSTGFIRGYMAKNMAKEKFLEHVVWVLERQLQEWDENYQVNIIERDNYIITVHHHKVTIAITLSASKLESLQAASPYALDRYLWTELKNKGLQLKDKNGNYLDYVFPVIP